MAAELSEVLTTFRPCTSPRCFCLLMFFINYDRNKIRQAEFYLFDISLSFVPRWQFASDGADIGFGVFLKGKMGEWQKASQMQEVLRSERYNAHLVPEDGSLTCERPGVCEYAAQSRLKSCS